MKSFDLRELERTKELVVKDEKTGKLVKTVSPNSFQVGYGPGDTKGALQVWGGIDIPSNVPPAASFGKLYAEKGITGFGVLKYGGLPVLGASADFSATPWQEQLAVGESNGETVKLPSSANLQLQPGLVHHLDSDGTWKLSRGLAEGTSDPPDLPPGQAYLATSVGFVGIAKGTNPGADGIMTRGYSRFAASSMLNVPAPGASVVGRPLYLSTTQSGKLDFQPAGLLVGTAMQRGADGSFLVFINVAAAGSPGPPGPPGESTIGPPGESIVGPAGLSKSITMEIDEPFFYEIDSYTDPTNSKNTRARVITLNRVNIPNNEIQSVVWEVKKTTSSTWLIATDDANYLTTTSKIGGSNSKAMGATLSVAQFRSIRAHNQQCNSMQVRATVALTDGNSVILERIFGTITATERNKSASLNADSNYYVLNQGTVESKTISINISRVNFYSATEEVQWQYSLNNSTWINATNGTHYTRTSSGSITVGSAQFNTTRSSATRIWFKAIVKDRQNPVDPLTDDGIDSNAELLTTFGEYTTQLELIEKIKGDQGSSVTMELSPSVFYQPALGEYYPDTYGANSALREFRLTYNNLTESQISKVEWNYRKIGAPSWTYAVTPPFTLSGTSGKQNIARISWAQFRNNNIYPASETYGGGIELKAIVTLTNGTVLEPFRAITVTLDGKNSEPVLTLVPSSATFTFNAAGTSSSSSPVNLQAALLNVGSNPYTVSWNLPANQLTTSGASNENASMSSAQYLLANPNLASQEVVVLASTNYGGKTYEAKSVINHNFNGGKGDTGGTGPIGPSFSLSATRDSFSAYSGNNYIDPILSSNSNITFTTTRNNFSSNPTVSWEWSINGITWTSVTNNSVITRAVSPFLTAEMSSTQFNTARGSGSKVFIRASVTEGGATYFDTKEVNLEIIPAPVLEILPSTTTFVFDSSGTTGTPTSVVLNAILRNIPTGQSYSATWSSTPSVTTTTGTNSATITAANYRAATGNLTSNGVTVTATATYNSQTYTATAVLNHTRNGTDGTNGTDGKTFRLESSRSKFSANSDGYINPNDPANSAISFSVERQRFASTTAVSWTSSVDNATFTAVNTNLTLIGSPALSATMTLDQFNALRGTNTVLYLRATSVEGETYNSTVSINLEQTAAVEIDRIYGDLTLVSPRDSFVWNGSVYNPNTSIAFSAVRGTGLRNNLNRIKWRVKKSSAANFEDYSSSNLTVETSSTLNPGLNDSSMTTNQFDTLRSGEAAIQVQANLEIPKSGYDPNVNFYDTSDPATRVAFTKPQNLISWTSLRSGAIPKERKNVPLLDSVSYASLQTTQKTLITPGGISYPAFECATANAIYLNSDSTKKLDFFEGATDFPFTISFWIKIPNGTSHSGRPILLKNGAHSDVADGSQNDAIYSSTLGSARFQYGFHFNGLDSTRFLMFASNSTTSSTVWIARTFTTLRNNTYHLTIVYDPSGSTNSTKLIAYLNGSTGPGLVVSAAGFTFPGLTKNTGTKSYIALGNNAPALNLAPAGTLISELSIMDTNLSASEVKALYNASNNGSSVEFYQDVREIQRTEPSPTLFISTDRSIFTKNATGNYQPTSQTSNFTVQTNLTGDPVWKVNNTVIAVGNTDRITVLSGRRTASMTQAQFDFNGGTTANVEVELGGLTARTAVNVFQDEQTPTLFLTANNYFFLKTRYEDYQPASQSISFAVQTNQTGDPVWTVNGSAIVVGDANRITVSADRRTASMTQAQFQTNGGTAATVQVTLGGLTANAVIRSQIVEDTLGIDPIIQIETGTDHSLALTASGKVYGWGNSSNGQLAKSSGTYSIPTLIYSANKVVKIQAGDRFSAILLQDGRILICGANENGRTGQDISTGNTENFERLDKYLPNPLPVFKDFALGFNFGVAVDTSNNLWTWGSNSVGQCAWLYNSSPTTQFGISSTQRITLSRTPRNFSSNVFTTGTNSDGFSDFLSLYNSAKNSSDYEIKVYAGYDHAGMMIRKLSDNSYRYATWGSAESRALAHVSLGKYVNFNGETSGGNTGYQVAFTNWAPRFAAATETGTLLTLASSNWSIGFKNNALLRVDGNVTVWGYNGARNIETSGDPISPQLMFSNSNVFGQSGTLGICTNIKINSNMVLASTKNGIYVWGAENQTLTPNIKQQFGRGLGNGSTADLVVDNGSRAAPGLLMNADETFFREFSFTNKAVLSLSNFSIIPNATTNSAFVSPKGDLVWAWGHNSTSSYKLGLGSTTEYFSKANRMTSFDNLIRVVYTNAITSYI